MERDAGAPNQGPVISFKVMDAVFAIVVIFAIFGAHNLLLAYSGVIITACGVLALAYIGYRAWDYHRFRTAQLDRYRLDTQRLAVDHNGNYDAIVDPKTLRIAQPQPGNILQPVPQNFSPHITMREAPAGRTTIAEEAQAAAPALLGKLSLPGPVNLIEVMRHFTPSPEGIYLGTGRGGKMIACSVEQFMHIAHDGPSGEGKTTQWKNEMVQTLKGDIYTFLANPHFAPISKKGEDWRPIGRAIEQQESLECWPHSPLLYSEKLICAFLEWLAEREIDRRFELQRRGMFTFAPLYGFVDEWPSVVEAYPEAGGYMATVLRRGRAVDVNISTNSQGFLVEDTGLNGAARANFQTAYWLGGSPTSGSKMLNMKEKDLNTLLVSLAEEGITLGKGTGLVRNNSVAMPAQIARLGHANNEYVYYMLGHADDWTVPEYRGTVSPRVEEAETTQPFAGLHGRTVVSEEPGMADDFSRGAQPLGRTVSRNETGPLVSSSSEQPPNDRNEPQIDTSRVSSRDRELIVRAIKQGDAFKKIAALVGLGSEQYPVFQAVCKELGFDTSKGNPYQKRGTHRS